MAAFLSKITRELAVDRYRERSRQKRIPSELTVSLEDLSETLQSDDTPEGAYSERELRQIIEAFVRGLPARQRYIFIKRYYLSSTIESMAGELGVGVATVHREIQKIKEGLREHLERNGVSI